MVRICKVCYQEKDISDYYKIINNAKGGITKTCRTCVNSKRNLKYEAHPKPAKYDIDFLNQESELRSYFLGLFMADGWLDNKGGVHISMNDKQIIDDLATATNYKNKILEIDYSNNNFSKHKDPSTVKNSYRISYYKLYNHMKSLGFTEKKTSNEFIPEGIENTFNHFLRGVSDGDGCFYYLKTTSGKYLQWELTCASEEFLNILCDKIKNYFGYDNNIKVYSRQGNVIPVFRIRCKQNDISRKLAEFMYKDCTLKLDRKYQIYLNSIALCDDQPLYPLH